MVRVGPCWYGLPETPCLARNRTRTTDGSGFTTGTLGVAGLGGFKEPNPDQSIP